MLLENGGPAGLPGDQWSEFHFLVNYLNGTVADANAVIGSNGYYNYLDYVGSSLFGNQTHADFPQFYYAVLFSSSAKMDTIDGGEHLAYSIQPVLGTDSSQA
jgi:hypothetical protein